MYKEVWKDIEGFEGKYQVSNFGRVRSLINNHGNPRTIPKILKARPDTKEYLHVALFKKGKAKDPKVHRLVAKAFISNPENKPQVNHIDGNKQNNRADNLEWVTPSENIQHAYKSGLIKTRKSTRKGERAIGAKLTNAQAKEIRRKYKKGSRDKNIYTLAKEYEVSSITILKVVNHKTYKEE